eukprot:518401_1
MKKKAAMKKKLKTGLIVTAVVIGGGIAIVATGGAVIAVGGVTAATSAGTAYEAANNPDGKITMMSESVPVLGYVASATHGIKGDKDRAKRAAAKCTASAAVVVTAVVAPPTIIAGVSYSAATNPDGTITKVSESIPVLGYVASATHGIKGDK